MIFYPGPDGTWFFPFERRMLDGDPVFLEEGEPYAFVPDIAAEALRSGQFTVLSSSRFPWFDVEIHLKPRDTINPNLDGKTYELLGCKEQTRKWPGRRVEFRDPSRQLDLFADPKVKDFVQCFWRDRADEVVPVDQPGHSVIYRAVTSAGASSIATSLTNSGWRVATFDPSMGNLTLMGMHALSVGAAEMPNPDYPPVLYCHHPAQVAAVIPGATYVSFLREPVRRLISSYHWSRDIGQAVGDLDHFVDYINDNGWVSWQMDWLARLSIPLPHSLSESTLLPYFADRTADGTRMSQLLVETANANLDKFLLLGLTECFDESLILAAMLSGSRYVGRWAMACRSSASDGFVLSERSRRRIEEMAGPEIALYQKVKAQFEDRFVEELSFIRRHIGSVQALFPA